MPLFKKGNAAPEREHDNAPSDALAQADLARHLDDEVWRAARYGRPLVLVCLAPRMLAGERLTQSERQMAIDALRACLRRSDVVGEAGEGVFVAVLPETDDAAGASVAFRLRSELSLRSAGRRQVNWHMSSTVRTEEQSGEQLLLAGLEAMRP